MASDRVQRRLAAIVAADVAGYSRLMGVDEEGTLSAMKSHLRDFVNPKIEEHGGKIVKTTGDGLLVEFRSVVDAVRCCLDLQQGMAERNSAVPTERRIQYRIGVNLGDVISDDNDIFGNGVNIAARLEGIADPGGICLSQSVIDQVQQKLDLTLEDLGARALKTSRSQCTYIVLRQKRALRTQPRQAKSLAPRRRSPSAQCAHLWQFCHSAT